MSQTPPKEPTPKAIAQGLRDIRDAVADNSIRGWALVGGLALQAHGVPRTTLDADAFVEREDLNMLAHTLVTDFGWAPLIRKGDNDNDIIAKEITIQFTFFTDGVIRKMIMLRSPQGLHLDLLPAQHPIERHMIESATLLTLHRVRVPVAPLGGILLVKTKADRTKDVAAIEQTTEHLPRAQINAAVAWAKRLDRASTEDLQSIIANVWKRLTPNRRTRRNNNNNLRECQ